MTSKKHFKAIAEIVKQVRSLIRENKENITNEQALNIVMNDLSNYFKTENHLFDEERFKQACE